MVLVSRHAFWLVPATAFGLGAWQIQRAKWKKGLLEEKRQRWEERPVDLARIASLTQDTNDTSAVRWRRVFVQGRWLSGTDMYLHPRVREGRSGAHLVSALQLEGTEVQKPVVVLVNRGWVPQETAEAAVAHPPSVDGRVVASEPVEFEGFVRHASSRTSMFTPINDPVHNKWYWLDQEAMARAVARPNQQVLPFAVEVLTPSAAPPYGGLLPPDLSNNHQQYYITWFSLSAFTAIMCWRLVRRGQPVPVSRVAIGVSLAIPSAVLPSSGRTRSAVVDTID